MVKDYQEAPGDPQRSGGDHGFRHYVIMSMLRNGRIDPAVVATIAGNTPETIYSNYASQVSSDAQRKGERVFDRIKSLEKRP